MDAERVALIQRLRTMQKTLRRFADETHTIKDQVERTNEGWMHVNEASQHLHQAAREMEYALMYWGRNGVAR